MKTCDNCCEELTKYRQMDTCCCGSPMDSHTMGDGHSPVSEFFYHMDCIEQSNKRLTEALKQISDVDAESFPIAFARCIDIARAALKRG